MKIGLALHIRLVSARPKRTPRLRNERLAQVQLPLFHPPMNARSILRCVGIRTPIVLLFTVFTLVTPPAFANNVYKWVDDDGQVHYSERKPNEFSTREIRLDTPRSTTSQEPPVDRQQKQKRLLDSYEKKRQLKREESVKRQVKAEDRLRFCEEAQRNSSFFARAEGARLARPGSTGEVEWIEDDERASIREYWRLRIEEYCD